MGGLVGWHHPEDGADQWDGFNDSGIETFAGSPIRSLAREVNQNALDAGASGTVEVVMRLHSEKTASIPDLAQLKANLKACLHGAKEESPKARIFFENALKELAKDCVAVLEVSDYNTHGMIGPCTIGTPYYAFMKAKGQSKKDSATAGGSFGIGKWAPYSASRLRTIFVSTVFRDGKKGFSQLTQGRSIFMSHDARGARRQGTGYWGVVDKCQPVSGVGEDLPAWLQRAAERRLLSKSVGTKLSVLCFDEPEYWEESLAVSVAQNFFGAIAKGKLRVDINSKYVLDRDTVEAFFANPDIHVAIDALDYPMEEFRISSNYLQALRDGGQVFVESSEMRELGHVQLRIIVAEGLQKRVCFLRNGMFISDSLSRLKTFSDFKDFVAVVQCVSKKGNELLRAMEPPKHDDFEPDRLPTKQDQKKGTAALKELAKWVRDMLRRYAKDPVSEVTQIDELKDFFGEEGPDGVGNNIDEINPYGEVAIHPRPLPRRRSAVAPDPSDVTDGAEGDDGEGGGGGRGGGGGDKEGGKGQGKGGKGGTSQKTALQLVDVRTVVRGPRERKVLFTPLETGRALLRILQAGADADYALKVVGADTGQVKDGSIEVSLIRDQRMAISIAVDEDYEGAVKVVANAV